MSEFLVTENRKNKSILKKAEIRRYELANRIIQLKNNNQQFKELIKLKNQMHNWHLA